MRDHNSHGTKLNENEAYIAFVKGTNVLPCLLAILSDIHDKIPSYGTTGYRRDIKTITTRYHNEGLSFVTKTLPDLFESLLRFLEKGESSYPGWKKCRGKNYPVFLQQLFLHAHCIPNDYSATCIECIYQLCASHKKMRGPYQKNVLVKQLDEFVATDRGLDFNPIRHNVNVLDNATDLLTEIVKGLDPFDPDQVEKFVPRPGPGAVNTPIEKHLRYRPHVFDNQLKIFGMNEWYNPPTYPPRGTRPWDLRVGCTRPCSITKERDMLSSRLKFVPKTFSKPRIICIEQLEMQWLQQGIRQALYDRVENHPLTKGYVSFTDQGINNALALAASRDKRLATLDMSSASDRIARDLVRYLFRRNEPLLKALIALSTKYIELPEEYSNIKILDAKKYAPMGSALCFPVMALIHFVLIKAIISEVTSTCITDIPVYVYGDDIIVESIYAEHVMNELPKFGMKMNSDKSFYKSHFRESCGRHAYNGVDITPVRFKVAVQHPLSINDVVGLIEQESVLVERGFTNTAAFIRSVVHTEPRVKRNNFIIRGPKSNALGWIRRYDTSLKLSNQAKFRRWNTELQCYEYKIQVIEPLLDNLPPCPSESDYYLRWLVQKPLAVHSITDKGVTNTARKISGCAKGLSIRWRWVTDSAIGSDVCSTFLPIVS